MENIETVSETQHNELLKLLNSLFDFLIANDYNFLIVAGKYGLCSRYVNGKFVDVSSMLTQLMKDHEPVKDVIVDSLEVLGQ